MDNKRKGISPLIASVLLLAVTLSVASIFSGWGPEVVRTVTDQTMNQTQNTIDCNKASVSIDSAKYFINDDTTSVVVRNTGTADLDQIQVSAWKDSLPIGEETETAVNRGDFKTVNVTSTSSEPDKVQAVSRECSDVMDEYEEIS